MRISNKYCSPLGYPVELSPNKTIYVIVTVLALDWQKNISGLNQWIPNRNKQTNKNFTDLF